MAEKPELRKLRKNLKNLKKKLRKNPELRKIGKVRKSGTRQKIKKKKMIFPVFCFPGTQPR